MSDSFINVILNIIGPLLVHSQKKDLSTPFLQHQLEMQLLRPSNMQHVALSKFIGLISLFLGPLMKSLFLKHCFQLFVDPLSLYVFHVYQQKDSHYICMMDSLGLLKTNPNRVC